MIAVAEHRINSTVSGNEGHAFTHRPGSAGPRPSIPVFFLCDKVTSREIWLPYDAAVPTRLDTGADYTCLHTNWMLKLGQRDNSTDPVVTVTTANGSSVAARRKQAIIRIDGFTDRLIIPVLYSKDFREDVILLGMNAIVHFYTICLTDRSTILFAN